MIYKIRKEINMSKKKKPLSRKAKFHKMAKAGETIYYGVKVGRNTGVYTSWNEVYKETHRFPGAKFKKFETYEAANKYITPTITTES